MLDLGKKFFFFFFSFIFFDFSKSCISLYEICGFFFLPSSLTPYTSVFPFSESEMVSSGIKSQSIFYFLKFYVDNQTNVLNLIMNSIKSEEKNLTSFDSKTEMNMWIFSKISTFALQILNKVEENNDLETILSFLLNCMKDILCANLKEIEYAIFQFCEEPINFGVGGETIIFTEPSFNMLEFFMSLPEKKILSKISDYVLEKIDSVFYDLKRKQTSANQEILEGEFIEINQKLKNERSDKLKQIDSDILDKMEKISYEESKRINNYINKKKVNNAQIEKYWRKMFFQITVDEKSPWKKMLT